ncbi:glycosyltransferase family 4 protein [Neiella sp. HB171785]|uniref:Glycosyltransferase family 4 protein n=1 Tax=Neiella litorisoli TaxID=2771431 RepID=A0A8J6UJ28_9GAMM|nr:glycosyltransferase family 4 protein [Neiella litorisoli]MBD1389793.1 glycosyltransferase family 4 protein [Neiella litorisoli]
MKKVLFISHGHPELSKGGAEVASWNLFKALQEQGCECLYVARTGDSSHGGSTFSARADDQVMLHTQMGDWFTLSAGNVKHLFDDLGALVKQFSPDVIHIHHYAHMGIEILPALRQAAPEAKIVFTLHEFMAICMHNGQMVKKRSLKLCYKATPADCHDCFPQHSPGDFFLRHSYLLDQFAHVDCFISPSQFLAERYIEWGIERHKMNVIENVLPDFHAVAPRPLAEGGKRSKFAFFGQVNPYKGIDVLLEAFLRLPDETRAQVSLDIHGANLDKQTGDLQEKVASLLEQLRGTVSMRGAYEPHQLPSLLAECDWVIIPSIWWENSPVVIQEAIAHGRPLIGSNIGGMKEKIEGKAGLTFDARSSSSLAHAIEQAMEPHCFDHWQTQLEPPFDSLAKQINVLDSLFLD